MRCVLILSSLAVIVAFAAAAPGVGMGAGMGAGMDTGSVPEALLARAEAAVDEANDLASADLSAARELEREAAAIYRTLIAEHGIDSAAVHRNLGVLELRLGSLGEAVASLKRAERRDPMDVRTRESLAAARGQVRTEVEAGVRAHAASAVLSWRGVLSAGLVLAAGLVLWGLVWVCMTANVVRPRTVPAPVIAVVLLGSLVCGVALAADAAARRGGAEVVVTADKVIARRGPSEAIFEPVFAQPLRAGVEADLAEIRGDWCLIRLRSGVVCWVPAEAVAFVGGFSASGS